MGVIYKITSPSNKIYIGKTYDLRKRINSHKCSARKNKNLILYNSIRKHGWDTHVLEVLENVEDNLLNERETYWIKEFNSYCQENPMGMNMTLGGDGQRSSWMHDLDRRDNQSKKYAKDGNPFYNKKHTEESKKVMSEKASIRNKERGITIPKWGVEKGRLKVIKACIAYNNKGEFMGEYDSLTNCAKALKVSLGNVSDCLLYGSWIGGKYMIKYKLGEDYLLKIPVSDIKVKTAKRAVLLTNTRGKIIKEYASSKEASEDLRIPKTTINRAAQYNKGRAIRTGHVFVYKDNYSN